MAEYVTPLPGLLAHTLETAINHVLQLDMESPERVRKLEGKLLQVNLDGLNITLFFTFKHGVVRVRLDTDGTPAKVQINGDASLARDLERIFSKLEPDWEAPLAGMLGDVAGHQAAHGIRQGLETARETVRTAGEIISDLLKDRRP
jgi:ubiquinone biosynthesis protein UbiJ